MRTQNLDYTATDVDVADTSLHVTRVGTGFPVVWLHGSGPGASGMSNFRQNLAAFSDFENLVIDHPRFGASGRPHVDEALIPYSGRRMLQAMDSLGYERFDLIGNSYGAGVAAWMAATAPERVRNLVLMAPGGLTPPSVGAPADLPYGLRLIIKAMAEGVDRDLVREFATAMVYDASGVTESLIDERYSAAVTNNPELEGVPVMGDLGPLLSAVRARTLLIWGRDDQFIPVSWSSMWLEGLGHADLHLFAQCGHWAQYEQREAFDTLVGAFLRARPDGLVH